MLTHSTPSRALPYKVVREKIFESVVNIYQSNINSIVTEYPFQVQFDGEKAVDMGGVSRDMFTAFFEEGYQKLFDGSTLLMPAVHPNIELSTLSIFGSVMSHAYMVSGVLPIRIAFPCLAHCFIGTNIKIPDNIMVASLIDSFSVHDAAVIKVVFEEMVSGSADFTSHSKSALIATLSRFGAREIPTPHNLRTLLLQIALCEFFLKPAAAIAAIKSGIPSQHLPFWEKVGVQGLYRLYQAKSVSPAKVLEMLDEAQGANSNQERVLTYLRQYVGSMNNEDLGQFLRFVTGSSVCMSTKVQVSFNTLTGMARRPIAHTCEPSLELPSTYTTYLEFVKEFRAYTADSMVWAMDAV